MISTTSTRLRAALSGVALVPFLLFACADNGSTGPDDVPPTLTITGVTDGGSYEPPVTITIGVAPGTYSATLNGEEFISGETVTEPGDYMLIVTGRNGLATTTEQIDFTVTGGNGGTGDVLIVRLLDLQLGTSGAPGDAILVTDSSAAGEFHALIDAGARSDMQTYVRNRLLDLDVDTLRLLQLTHAHFDHYAGMDEILSSAIHVGHFVYNGQNRSGTSSYVGLIDLAETQADTVTALTQQRTFELGAGPVATTVTMITPLTTYLGDSNADGGELNEGSLGTLIEHGGFRMFFTGDGEFEANDRWREDFASLSESVDVLKVGHHGANNATASLWLAHSDPATAVISANGTTHPRIAALERIHAITADVYCTNVHGEIRITVEPDGSYALQLEKNATADCVAGSQADT